MILGVDHLQIAVPDLAAAGALLETFGYQKEFEQEDLFDDREDGSLYGGRGKNIAYYQGADGTFSVELINCRVGIPGGSGSVYRPFFCDAVAANGIRSTIAVRTCDLERGERFWRDGLGFGVVEKGTDGRRVLEMEQNLFGSRVRLLLEACAEERREFEFIDDPGCVVLAFMTTDLTGDMERLRAHGGRIHGDVVHVRVNQRELTVGFVVGPCGEHVELIQWA